MATGDYLGGRSGVQYDGIQIEEDANGVDLQNVLLVGEFKRGPFNRPFKVTKETMEAKLSFDYNNPYYTFLEDAFEYGAEYIWVMRVSREQVVEPEPIWGDWILNSGVTVNTNGIAHYTAYKTNQREYYDSYANLDLTAAIVRSLHDSDMQQWQAVKDACNELTGTTDWIVDSANSRIIYHDNNKFDGYLVRLNAPPYNTDDSYYRDSPDSVIADFYAYFDNMNATQNPNWAKAIYSNARIVNPAVGYYELHHDGYLQNPDGSRYNECYRESRGYCRADLGVTPFATAPTDRYLSFDTVAQKIISNASSSNQAISLLAEAYLEAVASSIFNTDPSKQFVKLLDIEPDFEANKTQR